jgi:hypothetical protein
VAGTTVAAISSSAIAGFSVESAKLKIAAGSGYKLLKMLAKRSPAVSGFEIAGRPEIIYLLCLCFHKLVRSSSWPL